MKHLLASSFVFSFVAIVAILAQLPHGDDGDSLRMHQIYETTSWDLLEDLYLYHNAIRYFHDSEGLQFNRTLTDYARLKALILAWYDGDVPREGGDLKFGESHYWSPRNDVSINASDVIDEWYFEEEPKWNYQEPRLSDETKEFSQLVWNGTTRFGCGQAASQGARGGTYTVCYYDPPGNVEGQERSNVFAPSFGDHDDGEGEGTVSPGETVTESVNPTKATPEGLKFMVEQERASGLRLQRK